MSKVKGLNRVTDGTVRGVGEGELTDLAQARSGLEKHKKRNIPIPCIRGCGYIAYFSTYSINNLGKNSNRDGWVCNECRKKEQREVNQAILAVEARKKR